jgi:nucleotide-binding universal stress UspA family protein
MIATILRTILVAVDGSENGDRALSVAIFLARDYGSKLVIAHVIDAAAAEAPYSAGFSSGGSLVVRELEVVAQDLLARGAASAERAGVPVTTQSLNGWPTEAIVACANEQHADALVIGTQGKTGLERFLMGSTAVEVLRRSVVPVFVVPPTCAGPEAPLERILVALDGTETSEAALGFAETLARSKRATLILCSAVNSRDLFDKAATYGYDPSQLYEDLQRVAEERLAKGAARVAAAGLESETAVVEGEPAHAIVRAASSRGADAIVVGTHGRAGLQRLFLGSVAEGVTRTATVPVIVIGPERVAAARDVVPAPRLPASAP